jgi:hypothetical protein
MLWQEEQQELNMVADQPSTDMHALARRHNIPKTTMHTCLQRYSLYYPYWSQQVQALQPGDRRHQLQYCRWMVEKANEGAHFIAHVL